jgi:hypothetical protein
MESDILALETPLKDPCPDLQAATCRPLLGTMALSSKWELKGKRMLTSEDRCKRVYASLNTRGWSRGGHDQTETCPLFRSSKVRGLCEIATEDRADDDENHCIIDSAGRALQSRLVP